MEAARLARVRVDFWRHRHVKLNDNDGLLIERAMACIVRSREILERCRPIHAGNNQSDEWQPIATVPFDQNVEVAVIEDGETAALLFTCRLGIGGWINAWTDKWVDVSPTHWRTWRGQN